VQKIDKQQIVCEGETRFLERKLCKELYTAAAGLCDLYDIEGEKEKIPWSTF